jgi:hypothetical protein
MFTWKALWCFYNSTVLKTVSTLGLLGAISTIIPALINLPEKRDFPDSGFKTPIINYNNCRKHTQLFAICTILASLITPAVYWYLLFTMDWVTCDVKLKVIESEVYPYMLLLYALTFIVLFIFGLFYLKWQETLRLDKKLGDR